MSFVRNLFKGKAVLPESKPQLDPEHLRIESTEAFQRLKAKFSESGIDVRAGLNTDSLTFGDLVDILLVYYEATQFDSRCNFRSLYDIAKYLLNLSAFDPELLINEEMIKLLKSSPAPNELDRTNVLYTLPVDIATIIEQRYDDLSHYPGGIMITQQYTTGRTDAKLYSLLLNNRQNEDHGKPIKQIFEDIGLPVRSNIPENNYHATTN